MIHRVRMARKRLMIAKERYTKADVAWHSRLNGLVRLHYARLNLRAIYRRKDSIA